MAPAALALLAVLVGTGPLWALENANAAGPADAPTFAEDQPFAADVVVRNPNDFAVRVERVEANCACTRLDLPVKFLLPHATATLHAAVDNANRSGYQDMGVAIHLTDPDSELIPVALRWQVTPLVTVDALAPAADPRAGRPQDQAWRDVYRYTGLVRPDELHRLRKRILVMAPAATAPAGGFRILAVEPSSPRWNLVPEDLGEGRWLIRARLRDEDAVHPEGTFEDKAVVRTNHPRKPVFTLEFAVTIDKDAGRQDAEPLIPDFPLPADPKAP